MNFAEFNPKYLTSKPVYRRKPRYPDESIPEFELYSQSKKKRAHEKNWVTATKGIIAGVGGDLGECDVNPVVSIFFSSENMARIQKMIRREVSIRTAGKFSLDVDQDEADLLIAMRAVFFNIQNTGARFLNFKIIHQVKNLNAATVNYIMPDLLSNLYQSYSYLQTINQPLETIPRPLNVGNSGRKTLPSISTLYTR